MENPVNFDSTRSLSSLPGPLSEGNAKADCPSTLALSLGTNNLEEALESQACFHENASALKKHFPLTKEQTSIQQFTAAKAMFFFVLRMVKT